MVNKNTNANANANNNTNDSNSITVEAPELDNVFHWQEEHDCYKGQYMDSENKFQYERWTPTEETRWNNFVAKCKDTNGRWYTSGDGTGRCLGKQGPKRYVTAIIRLKTGNDAEYLLSNSTIIGYSAYGDKQITTAGTPEKFYKTTFHYEVTPNYYTGFSERRNTGPSGGSLIYCLPWSVENAERLFSLRENERIQFIVKLDEGQSIEVKKPQGTVQDTFKLFTENSFEYLYTAQYIPLQTKLINAKQAENQGLIPPMDEASRIANFKAAESLSQKDKMQSYG